MRVIDITTGTVIEKDKPYALHSPLRGPIDGPRVRVVEEAIVNAKGEAKIRVRLGRKTCSCTKRITVDGIYNPQTGDVEFEMPWSK